jgi:DNA-binding MurR/RpiR family transcriptional regulator
MSASEERLTAGALLTLAPRLAFHSSRHRRPLLPPMSTAAKSSQPASAFRDPTPWYVRFQRLLDEMTDGEKRVGSYFMEHPDAAQLSIGELIDGSGLGYGTVIRFCQKLGCRGFQEFKVLMARDAIAARPTPASDGTGAYDSIVARLNDDISRTAQNLDSREIERAAEALCKASRVVCIGVASSAPLALSLDWKIRRFGIPSTFVSDGYVMAVEASLLRAGAVLVAISSSGATKDIVTAARLARDGGATVIAVTNFTKAPLIEPAHIRLITSAVRDPLIAEVPSIVAGEAVFEILIQQIRRLNPGVDQTVLETFNAIADRKL